MSNTKAKTISLLLEEGSLNGVMCIEDSNWNAGELYSAPRESVSELISSEVEQKLIYIQVPAKTFTLDAGTKNGLYIRKDRPIYIDLNILADTLCDRRSGCDFSKYVKDIISYGEPMNVVDKKIDLL